MNVAEVLMIMDWFLCFCLMCGTWLLSDEFNEILCMRFMVVTNARARDVNERVT